MDFKDKKAESKNQKANVTTS
ncbi:uncharacterized protein G2W53_024754 [Senna tora]|uniref:Uncharacterized protein n=1 Tax=Senna tora TaxID=362788 RepID=A0A834TKP5_9FABA|nr:uncharacterized protein G2W53_024754 [Senna tora]